MKIGLAGVDFARSAHQERLSQDLAHASPPPTVPPLCWTGDLPEPRAHLMQEADLVRDFRIALAKVIALRVPAWCVLPLWLCYAATADLVLPS